LPPPTGAGTEIGLEANRRQAITYYPGRKSTPSSTLCTGGV